MLQYSAMRHVSSCVRRSHSNGWLYRISNNTLPYSRLFSATTSSSPGCFVVPQRHESVLLGCVSYDPAVGDIWSKMRQYFHGAGVPGFDFVLYSNYQQQVRALLDKSIDVAWNGPLAHVMCERAHADIVSLGMRDVDCDYESIVVVTKASGIQNVQDLNDTFLLSGAMDSPQGHVVPLYYLKSQLQVQVKVEPQNHDLGKHGDTAVGEVTAMQRLACNNDCTAQGALLSRMMWDRAMAGQLDAVDAEKLQQRAMVLDTVPIPKFDHCQFDALASTAATGKLDSFYNALHAMDYNDPAQQPIMKLEGIRRSWAKPRQEGYDIVREAMATTLGGGVFAKARNYQPRRVGTRAFSTKQRQDALKKLAPGSRIGVIGCGVAGLQVVRSMRARGFDVTAFDRANDVGGLWRENYDGYSIQVPKQFYEMPDFEMTKAEWGELAAGGKVQAYIKRFASEFDLERDCRLNTGIAKVTKNNADGTWTFQTEAGEEHVFDYCVVSTGMYSNVPFLPEVPKRDSFEGSIIHSSQFMDATVVKDKNIVVIGGGKSASDCATSAANAGAQSVTVIQRHTHWAAPLFIAGLIPFQHVFLSRLGQALVEAKVGVYPGSQSSASMFRPVMGPIFAVVEALFAYQLGLMGELRPKHGMVEDFYGYAQIQDGSFKEIRDAGKVDLKLGETASFTKEGVSLVSGEEIAADTVIFATGFGKDYSKLFEPDVMDRLDVQDDGLYLYKRILPASVDDLAFVGSETATIFNCTTYGIQAEWLARTLAGETRADLDDKAMAAEVQAFRDFARSWMPKTSSRSALVLLHMLHYHDQLIEDMGENPSRKSNPVAEYLGSYYSRDYDGIVGCPAPVNA